MKVVKALALLSLALSLAGPAQATSTFTVTNTGVSAYHINGTDNPPLTLVRGHTYIFSLNNPGHPFYIKTVQGAGTANADTNGVVGNGNTSGTLTFTVPFGAPNTLFYNCSIHPAMTNTITVTDPPVPGLEPAGIALLALTVLGVGGVAIRRRWA